MHWIHVRILFLAQLYFCSRQMVARMLVRHVPNREPHKARDLPTSAFLSCYLLFFLSSRIHAPFMIIGYFVSSPFLSSSSELTKSIQCLSCPRSSRARSSTRIRAHDAGILCTNFLRFPTSTVSYRACCLHNHFPVAAPCKLCLINRV